MPVRELLEQYPLYRRHRMPLKYKTLDQLEKPAIHMPCDVCASEQTFNMANEYYEGSRYANAPAADAICRVVSVCMSCGRGLRVFLLRFDPGEEHVMKVGQYPPWDIRPDAHLEAMLGDHAQLYKKGLVCESQGYGIGAFGYYRRIVERIIDQLLSDVAELLTGREREHFLRALERVKTTPIAQDKIAIVKDLLPPTLRPGGINPLAILHETLSEGLHEASDELCMELAAAIREALVFLVDQVSATRQRRATFTAGMRKLLERKAKRDA